VLSTALNMLSTALLSEGRGVV